jgi:hypothetical protein
MTRSPFNDALRAAAGRTAAPVPDQERPLGNIGIGVGGAAAPPPARASSAEISNRIRAGARLARSFTVPGGVNLDAVDVDKLFRGR